MVLEKKSKYAVWKKIAVTLLAAIMVVLVSIGFVKGSEYLEIGCASGNSVEIYRAV